MKTLTRKSRSRIRPANGHHAADPRRYLVGGVNSPVRSFNKVEADPIQVTSGRGAQVTDEAGRTYLDFIGGWGPLILGHRPPSVVKAVQKALQRDILFGLNHVAEAELAQLIAEAVPSVERVRFTTSGTEACMTAIRLARAVTGRSKILMFDGGYHGYGDSVMAGETAGIPPSVAGETLRVPYGDTMAAEGAISSHARELAAVIVEPVAANMGVIAPEPEFLAQLREATCRCSSLLIFDEVVTGFRVAPGGAQELFGTTPDLTIFGKIIGGGLPIGALGGPAELMDRLAPVGNVYHGGTFAGHPLAMASGIAALRQLRAKPPYQALDRLGGRLADHLAGAAHETGAKIQVNRVGSMLTVFFSSAPVQHLADVKASDKRQFAAWANGLRERGILVPPSAFEAMFLSTAHTAAQIDRLVEASAEVWRA